MHLGNRDTEEGVVEFMARETGCLVLFWADLEVESDQEHELDSILQALPPLAGNFLHLSSTPKDPTHTSKSTTR